VASRTKKKKVQIEVAPAVKNQLQGYETALQRGFNRRTNPSDLLGALLEGVPLWQAEAMLQAHKPQEISWKGPGDIGSEG